MIKATMKDGCMRNYSNMLRRMGIIDCSYGNSIDNVYVLLYEKYNKIFPYKDMDVYCHMLLDLNITYHYIYNKYYIKYYCETGV